MVSAVPSMKVGIIGDRRDAYTCLYSSAVGLVTDADGDEAAIWRPASELFSRLAARSRTVIRSNLPVRFDTIKGCGGDKVLQMICYIMIHETALGSVC